MKEQLTSHASEKINIGILMMEGAMDAQRVRSLTKKEENVLPPREEEDLRKSTAFWYEHLTNITVYSSVSIKDIIE